MSNSRFIEELKSVETNDLFINMLELTPIGTLIVNDRLEIVYFNQAFSDYFDGDIAVNGIKFGNIFKCTAVYGSDERCGTREDCIKCKLKNMASNSLKFTQLMNKIEFGRTFSINGMVKTKWFEVSTRPVMVGNKRHLWVTMKDTTELMHFKFEERIRNVHDDGVMIKEKDDFHNKVIDFLENQAYHFEEIFIASITIKGLDDIQNRFGYMWKNDCITSFYRVVLESQDLNDFVCREYENSFIVVSPFAEKEGFEAFIKKIKGFKHAMFQDINIEVVTATIKLSESRIIELKENNRLHIAYFKILAKLETSEEEDLIITL